MELRPYIISFSTPRPAGLSAQGSRKKRGPAPGVGKSQGGPERVALCGCWHGDRSTPHADTRGRLILKLGWKHPSPGGVEGFPPPPQEQFSRSSRD